MHVPRSVVFFLIVSLLMVLAGCIKQPVTQAVPVEKGSPFQYFPDTIQSMDNGWHRVNVSLRDLIGRREFVWQTDCQGRFLRGQQTLYEPDGTKTATVGPDAKILSVDEVAGFDKLEASICELVKKEAAHPYTLTEARAMIMLHGNYQHFNKRSRIKNICVSEEEPFTQCTPNTEGYALPYVYTSYREGGVEKVFLLTLVKSLHGDFPDYLGGQVFAWMNNRWRLESETPFVMMAGPPDQKIPSFHPIQLGSSKYGFLVTSEHATDQQNQTIARIIAPAAGKVGIIFTESIAENNQPECDQADLAVCWGYQTTMGFDKQEDMPWWDVVVNRSGNRLGEEGLEEIVEYKRYVMAIDQYLPLEIPN